MAIAFTSAVVGLLIINLSMLLSSISARPMERLESQTSEQFSLDTKLYIGLDLLEGTACPLGGRNWLKVEKICEVIQSLNQLEQSINVVSQNSSIDSTATEIRSLVCNKLENIDVLSIAPDCSEEKLELVCSRVPICWDAMEARLTLQAVPSVDFTSRWINDHIEDGPVKNFVTRVNP